MTNVSSKFLFRINRIVREYKLQIHLQNRALSVVSRLAQLERKKEDEAKGRWDGYK